MSFWNRRPVSANHISSQSLALFGRCGVLGAKQAGVEPSEVYGLVSDLNQLIFAASPADRSLAIAELHRHAQQGEWEKVGAWKYVREFMPDPADAQDLIDSGLMAIHRMRITNLAIHLAPIDRPRYVELTGGPPPDDGFFGPPAFDSDFGPKRQYYLDQAIAAAATRNITRLPCAPGISPGPIDDAARAVWDLGQLVYRGPAVVNPDIAFEPSAVRPAVLAASNVDHCLFAERLADVVLDNSSYPYAVWSALGGTRFIEDYLHPTAAETTAYSRLLDCGLKLLTDMREPGVNVAPQVLTSKQRERLSVLRLS